ncbi:hypothetical protein FLLO111716_08870 [Flavobacterium longum]|uniref:T9SS type A sorting domain-containing protein n=1 Tax=Flavobacterium longum TaxID=1299340 RepID=UPI0039ED3B76
MEHISSQFIKAPFARTLLMLFVSVFATQVGAQTTVTYTLGNNGYYTIRTTGTSGTFLPSGTAELAMYSNGGGTKNVVAYRDFKTAGDNTGSVRALQVGDIFSLQVWASSAFGHIGFSLNTSNVTTDYSTRHTNSRLYVQEDGTNGSWYVNSSAGNQTLDYNVSSTYRNYLFKVYITSETTCDVELIVDGSVTKRLFNRTMNGTAGANITGFALYLSDDYNGSANANVYWKQVTEVRANTSVNLGYFLTSGTFTPGKITNGLAANSTSAVSVNALNIGGDSGTTVILNQPNTYTGATTVNAFARAELQSPNALGSTSGVTVNNNGAISLYSPVGIFYGTRNITLNGNGQNGANGAIRNVGGLNSFSGTINVASNSRIQADFSDWLFLDGVDINLNNNVLTFGGTQRISSGGQISGTGSLIKTGSNELDLGAESFFSGGVTLQSGKLTGYAEYAFGSGQITLPAGAIATINSALPQPNAVSVDATAELTTTSTGTIALYGVHSGTGKWQVDAIQQCSFGATSNFAGTYNVSRGKIYGGFPSSFGTATINLGKNNAGADSLFDALFEVFWGGTVSNNFNIAANNGAKRDIYENQETTFTGTFNLSGNVRLTGSANKIMSGIISGSGGLEVAEGTTTLSAQNTYSGNTVVNAGATLRLGASGAVPLASNLILSGGTFDANGFGSGMNLLVVDSNSTIALGSSLHYLIFNNSSEEPWSGTLTITGWTGAIDQMNPTGGHILVGSGGLSAEQLSQIVFQGYSGPAIILPSGELAPSGPVLALNPGSTDHGNACVGTAATTITYILSNTGGDATDVSVVSDNPEFVVSNLSSTTVPFGGFVTYDVTFTPSAAGNRTATITIDTTTPGSNAPVLSNLSGTGSLTVVYYADSDNDLYGDPSESQTSCTGAPSGYVTDNTDCDDGNAAIYQSALLFVDADNDGYDAGQQTVCYGATIPAGYRLTTNGTDCDDTRNTVNPAATEIGYNVIDDDCDGLIDEGFPPKITIVNGTQCGLTLAAIDTPIVANIVAGATGYRWRITTLTGPNAGQIQTLDTALRTMKLTQLLSYAFNTQYKVEVAVYFAGFLQPYNASFCNVTTPEAITSLTNCTQTLTAMSNAIYANIVPYATGYRFRITDPINPLNTQVLERSVRDFRMTQITNFVVQFGKTYNVAVSVRNTDGSWMSYSGDCQVTTPVFPTTSVQDSQCDGYLVPSNSTPIYAISYPGAIAYVFQLSGGGLPSPIEVTKSARTFTLNDFAGQILPGATYNVKVRLVFNLSDPAGPYGKTCSITTPGASRTAATKAAFDAVAYPNPFTDNFLVALQSASTLDVNIKVYDMTGRLLEDRRVKPGADIETGNQLPSGVYNLVVTQGDEMKTLRVVKR